MAYTDVQICNLALGRIGVAKSIAILASEQTEEARQCRRFYELSRDTLLDNFEWPFANAYATLALVEDDPNDDWAYAYRVPADCIAPRRLVLAAVGRMVASPSPYLLGSDDDGLLLFTDEVDAVLQYTKRYTVTQFFAPSFADALAWKLAAEIASPLAVSLQLRQAAADAYRLALSRAQANSLNQQQADPPLDADSILARDSG